MKIEYLYLPFEHLYRGQHEKEVRVLIINGIVEASDHSYFDWLIGKPKSEAESWKPKPAEDDKQWNINLQKINQAREDYKKFVLEKENEKKWRKEKWYGFEVRDFDNI